MAKKPKGKPAKQMPMKQEDTMGQPYKKGGAVKAKKKRNPL